MNVFAQARYRLNIKKCNCLYFCPHYYEIFKKESNFLQNAIVIDFVQKKFSPIADSVKIILFVNTLVCTVRPMNFFLK